MSMQIVTASPPDKQDLSTVFKGLMQFNESAQPGRELQQIGVFLKKGDETVGGATGHISWGVMFLEMMWLPKAFRGEGWGSRLLAELEKEAADHKCTGIFLDTFGFQSPGFYEKHGFTAFGTLDLYRDGQKHHFMQKRIG